MSQKNPTRKLYQVFMSMTKCSNTSIFYATDTSKGITQ